MRALLEEGDWQDVFHVILPPLPRLDNIAEILPISRAAAILTQYRAECQCDLAKWMTAREQEAFLRERK